MSILKSILFIALINFLPTSFVTAQRYKHEFGIGPGYIELSRDRFDLIEGESRGLAHTFRIQSQLVFTPYQDGYSTYSNQYYRISSTLPAFYYSINIQKRLQFRASFQASFAKTSFDTYSSFPETNAVSTIDKIRKYDIHFGFNYNYLTVHTIKLFLGLGFNINPLVDKSTEYFRGIKVHTFRDVKGTMRATSSLGISIPLDQRIMIHYELAALKDETVIYFRPMSRLSLSYLF